MMIEIDEIISNAEYCADVYERMNNAMPPALQVSDYKRHAEDHRQLAGWLKDYKRLKEQEPCEDAISRQAAIDAFERFIHELGIEDEPYNYGEMALSVKNVPPVNPQPKVGHWIMKHRSHNEIKHCTGQDEMGETHTISVLERYEADEPYCSECGKRAGDTSQDYCCACGAKMQEVEE